MSPTDPIIIKNITDFADTVAIDPEDAFLLENIAKQSLVGTFLSSSGSIKAVIKFKEFLKAYRNIESNSEYPKTVALMENGGYFPVKENQYIPFNLAYQR